MSEEQREHRGRLKRAIAGVAPSLARALGGPLAGAAVEQLSRTIFGNAVVDEKDLATAIESATPEQRLALRQAEYDFKRAMMDVAVKEQKIASKDRDSARRRQLGMRDWTPSIIGALIIMGFFIVLGVMVARRLPQGAETEFSIMLGALATMTAAVVNYFFGSSAGSKEKTRLMATPPQSAIEAAREERS